MVLTASSAALTALITVWLGYITPKEVPVDRGVLSGFCPDFVFVAAQVVASSSVSRRQQGVASSLIGTLNLYGNSLGIGIAAIIESEVNRASTDEAGSYRAVLYFSAGICLVGLVLDVVFVRMPKDERDGWDDPVPEEHTSSL
ncbi:efflux pump antibiotic resistance [Seiridium cupressi]